MNNRFKQPGQAAFKRSFLPSTLVVVTSIPPLVEAVDTLNTHTLQGSSELGHDLSTATVAQFGLPLVGQEDGLPSHR